jgi:hypothetical protein
MLPSNWVHVREYHDNDVVARENGVIHCSSKDDG